MKPTPLSELTHYLNLKTPSNCVVNGSAIDSRLVKKGDLFFAIKGNKVDPHDFLKEVAAKGAVAACVSETYNGPSFDLQLLKVPDPLSSLQEIAKNVLKNRRSKVVGITGSMGKTTTKDFTAALLKDSFKVSTSPLSYNSKVTLPLSILMGSDDDEILILEMGMSEKGDIAKLIEIAPPDIACLTTITLQHSSGFPDGLEGIAHEKGYIFTHPKTKLGLINGQIPFFEKIKARGNCIKRTFSIGLKSDLSATLGEGGIYLEDQWIPCQLPLKAHYQNLLAAISIARSLDVPWDYIVEASKNLILPPMRFEKIKIGEIDFINDAYNANPEALKCALQAIPKPDSGKKIAVLSEMNALGDFSEEGHRAVAQIALEHVDLLLCIGKHALLMKKIWDDAGRTAYHFESKNELKEALKQLASSGDVVLLKGARTWALEELLTCYSS